MQRIKRATDAMEIKEIQRLTAVALEFESMKEQLAAIERRFQTLTGAKLQTEETRHGAPIRQLAIDVTSGMISQSLLTLTEHMRRGKILAGEKLLIEALPSGDLFETEVLASGNKLQERGAIAKFYRDAQVEQGDIVILSETKPGQWQLKKDSGSSYQNNASL
jgi:hypothetical protein